MAMAGRLRSGLPFLRRFLTSDTSSTVAAQRSSAPKSLLRPLTNTELSRDFATASTSIEKKVKVYWNDTMGDGGGQNYGLCHSCRKLGHWLGECPTKRRCTLCGLGYVRWLMAGESSTRCGKLFFNCSNMNCRYFAWDEGESSRGSSSHVTGNEDAINELCQMLRTYARIRNEENVEISHLTIRKTKANDKNH